MAQLWWNETLRNQIGCEGVKIVADPDLVPLLVCVTRGGDQGV